MRRSLLAAVVALAAIAAVARPAAAIPIFAQRYHLACAACHSVLPELNDFGNAFRDNGYRFPLPKHRTTILALREQISYTPEPAAGSRSIVPAGILLGQAEVGQIEAFLHYNLGSQGGPAAPYLAYLAHRSDPARLLVRTGLFELPLAHSPAQRLDTLESYGYEGTKVGLNDLLLTQPRLGLEAEYTGLAPVRLAATYAIGEYQGAAYGGKPIDTGITTRAARPEVGLFARAPLGSVVTVGIDAMEGARLIFPVGRSTFVDTYRRFGANVALRAGRFDLLAQQWTGHDDDADGAGGGIASNGGYVRVRYAPSEHAFVGVRYDAAAAPATIRAYEPYAEALILHRMRLLVEERIGINGGPKTFAAALTIGAP